MSELIELRREYGAAVDAMVAHAADPEKYAAAEARANELWAHIERAEVAQRRAASLARPVAEAVAPAAAIDTDNSLMSLRALMGPLDPQRDGPAGYLRAVRKGLGFSVDPQKHFRSLGEQLQAVSAHYLSHGTSTDSRLVRAPTGLGEVDPTGGGFLIQQDFATTIFMIAHDMGEILSRINKIPIGTNANGLKMNGIDETSRATGSRWGGVVSYWPGEANTVTPSAPKFREMSWDLKKLMALWYVTSEQLQDSTSLGTIAAQAFSEEIMFQTEDKIFEGSGSGVPLGIMNSAAKVAVAAEVGQSAATIVSANLEKMWARLWARARRNAVWYINQDCLPQLQQLNQAVGSAGGQLVYMPPGGLSAAPFATLMGRPIIETEYNSALGTEGDIMLADLSQYTLIDKGGINMASSMHVAFLSDQSVFRITYRVDGQPMWHAPLTPFKGSLTKSPFITLANR
jgi:HK97 family phage major capsid protein